MNNIDKFLSFDEQSTCSSECFDKQATNSKPPTLCRGQFSFYRFCTAIQVCPVCASLTDSSDICIKSMH